MKMYVSVTIHSILALLKRAILITLTVVLVLSPLMCKRKGSVAIVDLPDVEKRHGGGIDASARCLSSPEEIDALFHKSLPDSGIVPVQVTVRNNDTRSLRIHSSQTLRLGEAFRGFALIVDGNSYEPIHPLAVVKRMVGVRGATRYKRPGTFGAIAGSTIFPPLAGYHIYKEVKVGRYYRPLFDHSIYPTMAAGLFRPLTLEPGDEVSGFLYFSLPQGQNPYLVSVDSLPESRTGEMTAEVAASGGPRSVELLVKASCHAEEIDTIPLLDCTFPHIDGVTINPDDTDGTVAWRDVRRGDCRLLFALRDAEERGKRGELVIGVVDDLPGKLGERFWRIGSVTSQNVSIADASLRDFHAACALNFEKKSKVYLVDLEGDEPRLIWRGGFSRKVLRIFLTGEGLLAITNDGFSHFLSYPQLKRKRRIKLVRDIEDAAVYRENLLVFDRERGLIVFSLRTDDFLRIDARHSMAETARKILKLGLDTPYYVTINRGAGSAGDTLTIMSHSSHSDLREIARLDLPGKVHLLTNHGLNVLCQLEDGTLIMLLQRSVASGGESGWSHELEIKGAVFLPFRARTLRAGSGDFVAIGEEGLFARGFLSDFSPGAYELIETRVPVEISKPK